MDGLTDWKQSLFGFLLNLSTIGSLVFKVFTSRQATNHKEFAKMWRLERGLFRCGDNGTELSIHTLPDLLSPNLADDRKGIIQYNTLSGAFLLPINGLNFFFILFVCRVKKGHDDFRLTLSSPSTIHPNAIF